MGVGGPNHSLYSQIAEGEMHRQLPGLSPMRAERALSILGKLLDSQLCSCLSPLFINICVLPIWALAWTLWTAPRGSSTSLFEQTTVAITKRKIRCRWKFIFNISKAKWGFNMKIRALTSACSLPKPLGCFWLARTPTRLDPFQASAPLDEVDSSVFPGPSLGQK